MLQLTPQHRFFIGIEPIDFRKGIDAIAALCRQELAQDPMNGAWFVFSNRAKTSIKLLVYDGQGFWLCMKRFSQGRLAWWPKEQVQSYEISATHLNILLYQGNPDAALIPEDWRRV
jgi:transposase